MFYAHIVLAKKGPYARIWLAAHWDKKLTKAQVFETNIEQSVEGIMQPKVKLALRTSGHLLLGVVRIYSRKAKYLLADCNEAFVKIKMAFRPGMVDLPEEHREAAVNAITLPEVFHDFDTALPELNDVDIEAQFSINQSRADEITMREDYGSIPMSIHDEGFGDMAFDDADFIRDDPNVDENLMDDLNADELHTTDLKEPRPGTSRSLLDLDHHGLGENDGFGDGDGFGEPAAGLFEGDMFADAPLDPVPELTEAPADADSDDDMDGGRWDAGPPSTAPSSPIEFRPTSPVKSPAPHNSRDTSGGALRMSPEPSVEPHGDNMRAATDDHDATAALNQSLDSADAPPSEDHHLEAPDQTTLLHNEEESFALAPVDASALRGVTKAKRKRKLIVDEVKNISGEEMKSQLANTSDIITTLDLAPPTKRLMYWKDTGGVEKMFTLCSRDIKARVLFKNNHRHFQSRLFGLDDFSQLGPADVLALEQYQQPENEPIVPSRRGRKRKIPLPDPQELATTSHLAIGLEVSEARANHSSLLPDVHSIAGSVLDQPDGLLNATEMSEARASCSVLPELHSIAGSALGSPAAAGLIGSPDPHMLAGRANAGGAATPLLSPSVLSMGGRTPGNDFHDDLAPNYMESPMHHHGSMTPGYSADYGGAADIQSPAFTPSYGGGVTPHHNMMDQLEAIPNLPADQVSSILNGTGMENIGFSAMSERVTNDWAEDYDFPPEVAAHQPGDEQLENETDEQFEERVLNKRAAQMFVQVRTRMHKVDHMYLSEMTQKNNRKQAAQKFYSLLVLKKFQALDIRQDSSYGDILVTKGIMFDNPKL